MKNNKEFGWILNLRRLGESKGRNGVRDDCITTCKEFGMILKVRRLGQSWR